MFASTLDIAHQIRKFCEKDQYGDFKTCISNIVGTYTILDNGISMGSVEFDSNNRIHVNHTRESFHGEWKVLHSVIYDIGEKAEFDRKVTEWKNLRNEDSASATQPKEPTKEILFITYGDQQFYLLPFFKMHGIYGFVKFDIPPTEWTATENKCVCLIDTKHQGNYRLYDRDIPRTWNDAHTLLTSILETVPKEKDIPQTYESTKIGCRYYLIAIILCAITFFSIGPDYYISAIGSLLVDLGLSFPHSEIIVYVIHLISLTAYILAVPLLHTQVLIPYLNHKKQEGIISFYNRYRSAEAHLSRTYRILQYRCYHKPSKKKGYMFPTAIIVGFYILCFYSIITYKNNAIWTEAEKSYAVQIENERLEAEKLKKEKEAEKRKKIEQQNAEVRKRNAEREAQKSRMATTNKSSVSSATKSQTPPSPTANELPPTPIHELRHIAITPQEEVKENPSYYNTGKKYFKRGKVLEAIYWYQKAAESDYGFALQELGNIYEKEPSVRNYKLAVHYYTLASNKGIAYSHYRLGYLYEKGLGCTKNITKALDHYYIASCANLGSAQEAYKRLGGKKNFTDYVPSPASEQTTTESKQPQATPQTINGSKTRDKSQGATAPHATNNEKGSFQAKTESQASPSSPSKQATSTNSTIDYKVKISLIRFTDRYEPTLQDDSNYYLALSKLEAGENQTAFRLLENAAINGYDKAQYKLGVLYWDGKVTGKNMDRAAYWLRLAAEQRHPQSLSLLGIYYYTKRNNPQCAKLAFQALYEASKYADKSSFYYLGHCYEFGVGTPMNIEEAISCYRTALKLGIAAAELTLKRAQMKLGEQSN